MGDLSLLGRSHIRLELFSVVWKDLGKTFAGFAGSWKLPKFLGDQTIQMYDNSEGFPLKFGCSNDPNFAIWSYKKKSSPKQAFRLCPRTRNRVTLSMETLSRRIRVSKRWGVFWPRMEAGPPLRRDDLLAHWKASAGPAPTLRREVTLEVGQRAEGWVCWDKE